MIFFVLFILALAVLLAVVHAHEARKSRPRYDIEAVIREELKRLREGGR